LAQPAFIQCLLKYWISRSCFLAAASDPNVPRLRRLPVFGFFLREYNRYSPDFNLRIIGSFCKKRQALCQRSIFIEGMYTKQEATKIKASFWTSFGQYMRPLPGASGEPVNWLNYKTGIRHFFFRMDVDSKQASIAIELRHPDIEQQEYYYHSLLQWKKILEEMVGEQWNWQSSITDEDGKTIHRISTSLAGVNIFEVNDWPKIISFLKPRLIILDSFWYQVGEQVKG
jgi:hypothetical protein